MATSKKPLLLWCLGILLVCVQVALGYPAQAATKPNDAPAYTTAQVLQLIRDAVRLPDKMGFRQEVDARTLIGHYHWSATVKRDGKNVGVQAKGAPSFIPPEVVADFADFEKALAAFSLEYKGIVAEGGVSYLVIEGVRRPGLSTGATEGRLLVDPQNYLIRRTEARYPWGTAKVTHTYTTQGEFNVLLRQEATLSLLSARLTVIYSDYWFEQ